MIAAVLINESLKIVVSHDQQLILPLMEEKMIIDLKTQKAGLSENLAFCDMDRKSRKVSEGLVEVLYLPLYQKVEVWLYGDGYRHYDFYPCDGRVYWLGQSGLSLQKRKDSALRIDTEKAVVTACDQEHFHVRDRRVSESPLEVGRVIRYRAWTVLVHTDFLAVNHPLTAGKNTVRTLDPEQILALQSHHEREPLSQYSGFRYESERTTVELICPAIPSFKQRETRFSLISSGSSITMAVACLAVALTMQQSNTTMLVMPCVMLFSILFWPFVQWLSDCRYNRKVAKERLQWKQELIQLWQKQVTEGLQQQARQLAHEYPEGMEMEQGIRRGYSMKRKKDHPRFGCVNLGSCRLTLHPKILFEQREQDRKQIMKELQQAVNDFRISLAGKCEWDLKSFRHVAVIMDDQSRDDFLLTVLFSMAYQHDPTDLSVEWIGNVPERLQPVIHWLPHFRTENREIRLQDHGQRPVHASSATHWILSDPNSPVLLKDNEILWRLGTDLKEMDPECDAVIEVRGGKGKVLDRYGKELIRFETEIMPQQMRECALCLYRIDKRVTESFLPPDFHQILQGHPVPWHNRDCRDSICIPLGTGKQGQPVVLDLHERQDGPHGLIAGMTGSGKSRLIQTLILSAAWHYSPLQLQFVLIDYKGGSCADLLKLKGKPLPHLAAVLNNIETEGLARSLYYLKQESIKRQKIFLQAQRRTSQAVCDLDHYSSVVNQIPGLKPLAHLVIIIDEFAELREQQPELLQDLIRICRIGRSLGMHLILATQRPEGIVDEQMRSNFNFSLCLKVAQKQDSMDMIGCGEAATLKKPGQFYLRTSGSLTFGQAAWLESKVIPDQTVTLIDGTGRIRDTVTVRKGREGMQDQWMMEKILQESEKRKITVEPLCPESFHPVVCQQLEGWGNHLVIGQTDDLQHRCLSVLIQKEEPAVVYASKSQCSCYLKVLAQSLNALQGHLVILDPLQQLPEYPDENIAEQISLNESGKMMRMLEWIRRQLSLRKKRQTPLFVVMNNVPVLLERLDCLDLLVRLSEEGAGLRLCPVFITDPEHTLPSRLVQPIRFRMVLGRADSHRISLLLDQKVSFSSNEELGVVREKNVYQMKLAVPMEQPLPCDHPWHLQPCPEVFPDWWFDRRSIVLGVDPVEGEPVRFHLLKNQVLWVLGFNEAEEIKRQMSLSDVPLIDPETTPVTFPCIIMMTVMQFQKYRLQHNVDLSFVLWQGPGLCQQMIFPVPAGIREQRGMRYFFHYGQCTKLQGESNEKRDHTLF